MIIDELIAILGFDLRGQGDLDRFNSGMERAAALANRAAMAIVAAGTIAAGAMVALGKSVIDVSAEFEGYQTSLETIEGSSEKAKASMDWITKFAAQTPYELAGVTDAFIKLKSYGIDPIDGTLATLGDTASAMNKPLNMAVEAFADATSFQFERLREFGVVASQKGEEVTFTWTKNGKSFSKTIKKTGAEVQKFLKEHWGKSFDGAMIRQSKTWSGMMSNLGDSWQLFQKRIGDAGFFNNVKSRLAGLLDYIGKLDKDGSLDRWAKKLSDALTRGVDVAAIVIERLIKDLGTLGELIDSAGGKIADFLRDISDGKIDLSNWEAIVVLFTGLLAVLRPAWVVLALIALAVDDFLTYMRGGKSVIGDFIESIAKFTGADVKDVANVLGNMAKALGAVAAALVLLGSAKALAGVTTLATIGGLSMAGGLLALAGSAAAAAGSIQLLYDAMKKDPKLTKALGEQLFNAGDTVMGIIDKWFFDGDAAGPDNNAVANPVKAENKPTPMDPKDRKKDEEAFSAPEVVDYKLELARKEAERTNQVPKRNSGIDMVADLAAKTTDKIRAVADRGNAVLDAIDYRFELAAREAAAAGAQPTRAVSAVRGTTDTLPGKSADDQGIGERVMSAVSNLNAHLARMSGDAVAKSVDATITDARQDNRQYPVSVTTTVHQTVTQVAQAAAAAASATASAVSSAAKQAARTEGSPAF